MVLTFYHFLAIWTPTNTDFLPIELSPGPARVLKSPRSPLRSYLFALGCFCVHPAPVYISSGCFERVIPDKPDCSLFPVVIMVTLSDYFIALPKGSFRQNPPLEVWKGVVLGKP